MSICSVLLLCLFVLSFCCVNLGCFIVSIVVQNAWEKGLCQSTAAGFCSTAAGYCSTAAGYSIRITAGYCYRNKPSARDKMPAAEEQPPSSPTTSQAKSVARSPAQSPGRLTKNSNKPTGGGSTVEDGGSMTEEGGSTLQGTTAEASKKRKIDKSAADNVGSSSSQTGRVRREVDRLGNFSSQDHNSDEDGKSEVEDASDEDDDDEEDDIPSQPLTPSRSLELPIIKHLKKGRHIKSVSPLGETHPDPNFHLPC